GTVRHRRKAVCAVLECGCLKGVCYAPDNPNCRHHDRHIKENQADHRPGFFPGCRIQGTYRAVIRVRHLCSPFGYDEWTSKTKMLLPLATKSRTDLVIW